MAVVMVVVVVVMVVVMVMVVVVVAMSVWWSNSGRNAKMCARGPPELNHA